MSPARILIEPAFSVELRTLGPRGASFPSERDFMVVRLPAADECLLINPQGQARAGVGEVLAVRLAPELLLETAARLRLVRAGAELIFRRPRADDARLGRVLAEMGAEMAGAGAGRRELIGSLVSQLAVYLLRAHINVRPTDEVELSRVGIVDRRLRRALEFMHDNCGRELRLAEIAAAAYLSAFHFARLFKKITGTTPHAHLAALRIARARRLLAETDLPVGEVGARVGYESQSHFTKVFREATGLTPRAFRAAAQE